MRMKASQASDHPVYHGRINHRLAGFGQELIILAESTILPQPGKGAFNHPTMRKPMEPLALPRTAHHFNQTATVSLSPFHQRAGVASIGPYPAQPGPHPRAFSRTRRAPSRSGISAACTTATRTRPSVSTSKCRFRPFTFLPASSPRGPLSPSSGPIGDPEWRLPALPGDLMPPEPDGAGRHESVVRCHPATTAENRDQPFARVGSRGGASATRRRCAGHKKMAFRISR